MSDSDSTERTTTTTKTRTTVTRPTVVQMPVGPYGPHGTPYGGQSPYPPQSPYGPQYGPHGSPMIYQQPGMPPRGMRNPLVFMPPPAIIPGVPRGLEYLASVDEIVVNQLIEWLEVFVGIETRNRYSLLNGAGQQVYFAYEQSSFLARQLAGRRRPFSMIIADNFMQPVILVHRPYNACAGESVCGFNGCWEDECLVECPPGNQIGRIVQKKSCCNLEFFVENMAGEDIFMIAGPVCTCAFSDHDWPIFNVAGMVQLVQSLNNGVAWLRNHTLTPILFMLLFPASWMSI